MTLPPPEPACPYLAQVHRALPRVLALYDRDPLGATYGLGDRTFWAWKLKDFPNATQQGAVNRRLRATDRWPKLCQTRGPFASQLWLPLIF